MLRRIFLRRIYDWLSIITLLFVSRIFKIKQALAYISPEAVMLGRLRITPSIPLKDSDIRPKVFANSNNIRRKTGSPFIAKGEFLSISGYVVDLLRVPIADVSIKLWHANHMGYYNHLLSVDDDRYDIDMMPSGSVRTDNFGYYRFITIVPGYYDNRAPHLHIIVNHEHFKTLETEIFLADHPLNDTDPKYQVLSKAERSLLTAEVQEGNKDHIISGKMAFFVITLDGLNRYKRY